MTLNQLNLVTFRLLGHCPIICFVLDFLLSRPTLPAKFNKNLKEQTRRTCDVQGGKREKRTGGDGEMHSGGVE